MKNVYLIPTPEPSVPSRLFYKDKETLVFNKEYYVFNGVNIYITSEKEDFNENDYVITKDGRLVQVSYLLSKDLDGAFKVVIASDPDLIADGVQEIPDEFLEYLVKNPSCEWVEVDHERVLWEDGRITHYKYKINIPQDQPNQETVEEAAEKYGWRIKINTFSDKVKANELAESAQQDFIEGAKSDAARDYWFKIFKEQ